MMRTVLFSVLFFVCTCMVAQIGYQVSLLNTATGEPRANETVSVTVTITNSEDKTLYSSTQTATTNDFGILSLTVGNSTMFEGVEWSKLPFFVSATVDGIMVAKSQILNVPVAEAAKTLTSDFTLEELCGKTWKIGSGKPNVTIDFNSNGTATEKAYYNSGETDHLYNGNYKIIGNMIHFYFYYEGDYRYKIFSLINGQLYRLITF